MKGGTSPFNSIGVWLRPATSVSSEIKTVGSINADQCAPSPIRTKSSAEDDFDSLALAVELDDCMQKKESDASPVVTGSVPE